MNFIDKIFVKSTECRSSYKEFISISTMVEGDNKRIIFYNYLIDDNITKK